MQTIDRGRRSFSRPAPGRQTGRMGINKDLSPGAVSPAMSRYGSSNDQKKEGFLKSAFFGSSDRREFRKEVWEPKKREMRATGSDIRKSFNKQEQDLKKYFKNNSQQQSFKKMRQSMGISEYEAEKNPVKIQQKMLLELRKNKRAALNKHIRDTRKLRKELWRDYKDEKEGRNKKGRLFSGSVL